MEWLAALDFENLANGILILVVGLAAIFGFKAGKKTPAPQPESFSVDAALVDSASVKQLTTAIEHQAQGARVDAEKARSAVYELMDAINDMTKEVRELRGEVRRLGDMLARR